MTMPTPAADANLKPSDPKPSGPKPFAHRALIGWISEFDAPPLPGPWPQFGLGDAALGEMDRVFALAAESGYTEIALWGLFVADRWPLDIESAVDADRRARIGRVLRAAHAHGLKALAGLGLYSWGFAGMIEARPHLSRGNPRVLCPSLPESHRLMDRVVEFVLGGFDVDGLNMQSSDLGRCPCPDCAGQSWGEYQAALNIRVARTVRDRWPGRTLVVDNWGWAFDDPRDFPAIAAMSRQVDYIIDTNNSAGERRAALIPMLSCPFGTLVGRSVWPPQWWPPDKWFLPTTLINVPDARRLAADGGRAAEQFAVTRANPSGEVTLRFMGLLLADPGADPDALLRRAVAATYGTADPEVCAALAEIVSGAEAAYFATTAGQAAARQTGLFFVDEGFLSVEDPREEGYLKAMTAGERQAYGAEMARLASRFTRLVPALARPDTAALTRRCFENVLADVRRWEGREG